MILESAMEYNDQSAVTENTQEFAPSFIAECPRRSFTRCYLMAMATTPSVYRNFTCRSLLCELQMSMEYILVSIHQLVIEVGIRKYWKKEQYLSLNYHQILQCERRGKKKTEL